MRDEIFQILAESPLDFAEKQQIVSEFTVYLQQTIRQFPRGYKSYLRGHIEQWEFENSLIKNLITDLHTQYKIPTQSVLSSLWSSAVSTISHISKEPEKILFALTCVTGLYAVTRITAANAYMVNEDNTLEMTIDNKAYFIPNNAIQVAIRLKQYDKAYMLMQEKIPLAAYFGVDHTYHQWIELEDFVKTTMNPTQKDLAFLSDLVKYKTGRPMDAESAVQVLCMAIPFNNIELIKHITENYPIQVNEPCTIATLENPFQNPLVHAVTHGQLENVKAMLATKPDLNKPLVESSGDTYSILSLSLLRYKRVQDEKALYGKMIELLLERGATRFIRSSRNHDLTITPKQIFEVSGYKSKDYIEDETIYEYMYQLVKEFIYTQPRLHADAIQKDYMINELFFIIYIFNFVAEAIVIQCFDQPSSMLYAPELLQKILFSLQVICLYRLANAEIGAPFLLKRMMIMCGIYMVESTMLPFLLGKKVGKKIIKAFNEREAAPLQQNPSSSNSKEKWENLKKLWSLNNC